jgi:hypothetical protein
MQIQNRASKEALLIYKKKGQGKNIFKVTELATRKFGFESLTPASQS